MNEVTIYTDGSCDANGSEINCGGWAAVLIFADGKEREISGKDWSTTSNRMEIMAAIMALESLTEPHIVTLCTDSQYLQKSMSGWLRHWKRNDWRTKNGQPVKNRELWERLDAVASKHQVRWMWVRGHVGTLGNERADQLANASAGI